jgi:F0F1-type ATP synthase membrane subunit b/b'
VSLDLASIALLVILFVLMYFVVGPLITSVSAE